MGRGPNATMSFTYWKARAESIAGRGPVSDGSESLGRAVSVGVIAGEGCVAAGVASLSRSQAARVTANESIKIGRGVIFITRLAHAFRLRRSSGPPLNRPVSAGATGDH